MRKVLLFLLLFGGGLAALSLVIHLVEGPVQDAVEPTDVGAETDGDETGSSESRSAAQVTTQEGQRIGVLMEGRLRVVRFDESADVRRPVYELRAADVVHQGVDERGQDLYDLVDLELDVFDVETGEVRLDMQSTTSRVAFFLSEGDPLPGNEDRLVLNNVEAVMHRGVPIVPLALRRVPRVEVDARTGDFDTTDFVQLDGPGVVMSGSGMSYRSEGEFVQLVRDGRIEAQLDPAKGITATLVSVGPGPLVIRRRPDLGPEAVELLATEGTELTLSEAIPAGPGEPVPEPSTTLRMTATRISIIGSSVEATEPGGEDVFHVRELTARGGVVVYRAGDEFRSEHGRLEFDDTGTVTRAWLGGSPTGLVALDRWLDAPRFAGVKAVLEGEGPLVLNVGGEPGFDMTGPCTLRTPERDAWIEAREWLRGSANDEEGTARLDGRGDVRVRFEPRGVVEGLDYEDVLLEADALVLDASKVDGALRVVGRTGGPTHLEGRHVADEDLTFDSEGDTVFELVDEALFVQSATGVHLVVEGERGWDVIAGEVRELDVTTLTFELDGGVVVVTSEGEGTAQRAIGRGREDVELYGTPEIPAVFRFLDPGDEPRDTPIESGRVEALAMLVRPDHLEAVGAAEVRIAAVDRTFEMSSDAMIVDIDPRTPGAEDRPRRFHLESQSLRRAVVRGEFGEAELEGERLVIDGTLVAGENDDVRTRIQRSTARADGGVRFKFEGAVTVEGWGEHFLLNERGQGRIWTDEGRRVRSVGDLPGNDLPYELTADWIEFDAVGLLASRPSVRLDEFRMPLAATPGGLDAPRVLRATASYLSVDQKGLLLSGDVDVRGITPEGEAWRLDAGFVQLVSERGAPEQGSELQLVRLHAWGGFVAFLGSQVRAEGERLEAQRVGILHIEGAPARLDAMGFRWEAGWIDYDARSLDIASDRGVLQPTPGTGEATWRVRYESMQPFERTDSTILALRKPVVERESSQIHANWALFWVDREEWRKLGAELLEDEESDGGGLSVEVVEPVPPVPLPSEAPNLFGQYDTHEISHILTEAYFEGDVEVIQEGQRFARVESVYIDLVDGHGWINQAHVTIPIQVEDETHKLHVKTEWMRHSRDGTLRADHAVLTASPFDEPTYVIETEDLELIPLGPEKGGGWDVNARKNSFRFSNGLKLPFPPVNGLPSDEHGPRFDLIFGRAARFGQQVGATFEREISKPVVNVTSDVFNIDIDLIEGRESFNASYLGSRGVLLGAGFEAEVKDEFWLNLYLDGISDGGKDRGLIQVDKDDRSRLRTWFRGRARYFFGPTEWIDFAMTTESDPGVQSEFFEREFLRYEERDNYVHWRKARGSDYYKARIQGQLDEETTTVERLPEVGFYRGRKPVGELFGRDLLYSMTVDAGYLRRREGDPQYNDPFGPNFVDQGLGDRETLRLDNEHKLELPIETGVAGIKATPFVSGRATAWDESVDEDEEATRAGLFTGLELGTRFWRTYKNGTFHEIAPRVGWRTDVVYEDSDERPVQYDRTENPYDGDLLELGVRSRWWTAQRKDLLDVELTAQHVDDVSDGVEDGWLPLGVLAYYYTAIGGMPVGFSHDGRYDFDDGETRYSRSAVGWTPHTDLGFEFAYSRAREESAGPLFEAAALSTLWRATDKWEFEALHAIDLLGNGSLFTEVIVRRFGVDFVFEIEVQDRAGEGSSYGFSFRPIIGYDRAKLRYVNTLRQLTGRE